MKPLSAEVEPGWVPPMNLEEKAKALLVPPSWRLRYLLGRERRRGEREFQLLPHLVPRGRTALDIGANKGVWAAALLGYAREVHAFEPNPKIFRELERLLAGRAHLHRLALSDRSGPADFLVPKSRKGYANQNGSLSPVKVSGEHGIVHVRAERLDDLGIEDVGFMKIDVEGFESEVIKGAAQTIRRDRPVMVVEMEERHTRRPVEALIEGVTTLGYDGFALIDGCLTRWERIDLDARHRRPKTPADYIFNFVFLPKP